MELRNNCRKLTTALSRFWHREAGPMNWKNPVRVTAYIGWEIFNGVAFLVGEWVRYGVRAGQLFLAIPPTVIFFFGGAWYAVWHFVRRPFPALETVPLLDLLEYHNPHFYSAVVIWYYLSPLVVVMLGGSIVLSIWKVWIEARKRDLIPFGALPAWPLSPEQPGPEIVIGEVHHPVEPRGDFQPRMADHPGARTVYRHCHFWSGGQRQNFGLYAPLRQAATRLASGRSRAEESALSRIASCAMQGGGELPWEVTCRGVVDGIAMVIHMTRREGRRFVEEAVYVDQPRIAIPTLEPMDIFGQPIIR